MEKYNPWEMNRAGLVNFWYYDEEIFDFANGKLLLRGSNGSGKSVTMQSFLPVLLDGKKTPDRLDPFGSRARKMEDYLLGEYDVTKRDERTGYLFIEYKKRNTNRYITTGIGLKAKRHKSMDFWGFIIKDGRRIGRDMLLYKKEKVSGGIEKIPLTKKELENSIGDGGVVVSTQKEYMGLVNKYVFGFESIEAFDDLIKLLIQLRSPKLSKDFKPTVMYNILEESLPELGDDELRSLSDTIENMDQTKHQLEQLERDYESLERLCKQYEQYNRFILVDKANELLETEKTLKKRANECHELQNSLIQCQQTYASNLEEDRQLKREQQVFQETKSQLDKHEVFNAEEEKRAIEKRQSLLQKELEHKQTLLEHKEQKERELKTSILHDEQVQDEYKKTMNEQLDELEIDAQTASFNGHRANVEDFIRHQHDSFDFTLWKKEASGYDEQLQQMMKLWHDYENLKYRFEEEDRQLGEARKKLDSSRRGEEKWTSILHEEKSELLENILRWIAKFEAFQLKEQDEQLTAQKVHDLFDSFSFQQLLQPFSDIYHKSQERYITAKATINNNIHVLQQQRIDKERELMYWQEMREPELALHPHTAAARELLKAEGSGFIPFYKAVEFKDDVTDMERINIESALRDAGILDALIVENIDLFIHWQHDKILQATNQLLDEQQSLLKWLYIDLPDDANVEAEHVKRVLQSIAIDAQTLPTTTMVAKDGCYQIGLLHGHAPLIAEGAQYIGTQARERYRQMRIQNIEDELCHIREQLTSQQLELQHIQSTFQQLKEGYEQFPSAQQVETAHGELKLIKKEIVRDQQQVNEKNVTMKQAYLEWEKVRVLLKENTSTLNIAFSKEAYEEATLTINSYLKFLHELQLTFAKYEANRNLLHSKRINLEELIEDIDSKKGELSSVDDKLKIEQLKLREIHKRLEELGADDIRQQIEEVIDKLDRINRRLLALLKDMTSLEKDIQSLTKEFEMKQQEKSAYDKLFEDWLALFIEECRFQPHYEAQLASDPLNTAKLIVKDNSELLKKEYHVAVSEKLAKAFYREQQTLVEYRLSEEVVQYNHPLAVDVEQSEEMKLKRQILMEKSSRIMMLLDYKGQRVTPSYVLQEIAHDIEVQKEVLNETDRELYEEIHYRRINVI